MKGPLPITDVCLCAPDFVMMFKIKTEDRWVIGRRICAPAFVDGSLGDMAVDDAFEYLAGNYSDWAIHCQHCGRTYAQGAVAA